MNLKRSTFFLEKNKHKFKDENTNCVNKLEENNRELLKSNHELKKTNDELLKTNQDYLKTIKKVKTFAAAQNSVPKCKAKTNE